MKTPFLATTTLALVLAAVMMLGTGTAFAQSNNSRSERKKGGIFSRLREQREQLDAQTQKRVESAAKALKKDEDAQAAVKKAAEALNDSGGDTKSLLEAGEKLLKDPDSAMTKSKELAGDEDLVSAAAKTAEKLDADALRAAAEKLAPLAGDKKAMADALTKAAGATAAGNGVVVAKPIGSPGAKAAPNAAGIPTPVDPVVKPIPRPSLDPATTTRITAEQATFNANTNLVTFEDNVELDHPEFDLTCDILEAELKNQDGAEGEAAPVPPTQQAASGGIERATATGYVVIEKLTPDGETQVAKARKAVYESATGNVVLMIFPQLQDGKNLIKGTSERTRIFLRPNGEHHVEGPAEFVFVTPGDSNPLNLPASRR